jgi:hypothetical protein
MVFQMQLARLRGVEPVTRDYIARETARRRMNRPVPDAVECEAPWHRRCASLHSWRDAAAPTSP